MGVIKGGTASFYVSPAIESQSRDLIRDETNRSGDIRFIGERDGNKPYSVLSLQIDGAHQEVWIQYYGEKLPQDNPASASRRSSVGSSESGD